MGRVVKLAWDDSPGIREASINHPAYTLLTHWGGGSWLGIRIRMIAQPTGTAPGRRDQLQYRTCLASSKFWAGTRHAGCGRKGRMSPDFNWQHLNSHTVQL